jgi:heme oxygenase
MLHQREVQNLLNKTQEFVDEQNYLKELEDMHLAHQTYLEKHINVMNKDVAKVLKKRDYLQEFIKYGRQNN